jgi:hypothetical protein
MTKGGSGTKTFVAPDAEWDRFKNLCILKLGKKASQVMREMMLNKLAELEGMVTTEQKQDMQLTAIELQAKNDGLRHSLDKVKKDLQDRGVWDELVSVVNNPDRDRQNPEYAFDHGANGKPEGNVEEVIAKLVRDYPHLKGEDIDADGSEFQTFIEWLELFKERCITVAKLDELKHIQYAPLMQVAGPEPSAAPQPGEEKEAEEAAPSPEQTVKTSDKTQEKEENDPNWNEDEESDDEEWEKEGVDEEENEDVVWRE